MRTAFFALALAVSAEGAVNFGKLAEQLSSAEREQRREASWQLRTVGPDAKTVLPQLIKALDDEDTQVFSNAIAAIAEIGPGAKDAIPALMGLMDGRKGRGFRSRDRDQALYRAAFALSRIGVEAHSSLIGALKGDDTSLRRGAAKALGMSGPDAKDAIPSLIENLGHDDESLRRDAVEALALIGPFAVEPLIASLRWPDPRLREGSARALGELGAGAEPLFRAATEEKETAALAAAILALPKSGMSHDRSVPVLIKALCDERTEIHRAAVNAFVLVRPPGNVAVPAVAKLLDGPHAARAAAMLGHFGPEAGSAAPALLAAAKRTTPPAKEFLEPLAQIGAAAVPALLAELTTLPVADDHWVVLTLARVGGSAVPTLEKAFASQSAAVRFVAVRVLAPQGSAARGVQNSVLKLAGDPEPLVRAAVLAAVTPLGIPTGRTVELISALVKDAEPQVRRAAAEAAGALGATGRPLADELVKLVGDSDSSVRIAAMKSIGAIGAGADAAKLLGGHLADPALRSAALEALAKIGSAASPAVPQLIAIFPNAEPHVRAAILDVLAVAGDVSALPIVEGVIADPNDSVRRAAVAAFCRLQRDKSAVVDIAVKALKDSARPVREAAAAALAELSDRGTVPAIRPLMEVIMTESDHKYAMEALRALRVRDTESLAYAFSVNNDDLRMWAADRVGRMGKDGAQFIPEIEILQTSGNDGLRDAGRRAMKSLRR